MEIFSISRTRLESTLDALFSTQFQPIFPQMHVSSFEHFGTGSARIFLPLGIPHCSGSDLQPSSEEVTPSENVRNALMDVDEI
jgi:hypothetical protein